MKLFSSYTVLIILRILFVFFGFGYIHPDAFFQSSEVVASDVFGFDTVRTWEFEPSLPCRTIFTPAIFSGIPFLALKALSYVLPNIINPYTLLYFPRIFMFLASFVLDVVVWEFSGNDMDALFTLGSSWVLFVLINNGFSNSIETILVALALKLTFRPKTSWSDFTIFGAFLAVGFFNRITFAVYALPLVLYLLYVELKKDKKEGDWQGLVTGIMTGFFFMSLFIILIDSIYFGSIRISIAGKPFRWLDLLCPSFYTQLLTSLSTVQLTAFSWTMTPINNLQYNMKAENLAEHGTHLRITHLLWNLPMLFGPLAVLGLGPYYFWLDEKLGEMMGQPPGASGFTKKRFIYAKSKPPKAEKTESKKKDAPEKKRKVLHEGRFNTGKLAILGVILSPLVILSFAHHQEMRFLYAILVPLVILGYKTIWGSEGNVYTKGGWIAFNLVLLILLGVHHQGGLVPTILKVASNPTEGATTHVVFYQTYMPPRHLFAIEKDAAKPKFAVYDLKGAEGTELKKVLLRITENYSYSALDKIYVVSPAAVSLDSLGQLPLVRQQSCHLSGEHWPENLGDWLNLKLNVYEWTPQKKVQE
eukprot:TRINITY_DN2447_c0_g1_i1.p1 TRINITY_DN2447_c0_g1~~TRINITY_DN2447_c0_g1_i1.p1  ORF type:complete len:587 (-),score=137.05 TRINITY_DN2447_c0_g1_i1:30-1790(-)